MWSIKHWLLISLIDSLYSFCNADLYLFGETLNGHDKHLACVSIKHFMEWSRLIRWPLTNNLSTWLALSPHTYTASMVYSLSLFLSLSLSLFESLWVCFIVSLFNFLSNFFPCFQISPFIHLLSYIYWAPFFLLCFLTFFYDASFLLCFLFSYIYSSFIIQTIDFIHLFYLQKPSHTLSPSLIKLALFISFLILTRYSPFYNTRSFSSILCCLHFYIVALLRTFIYNVSLIDINIPCDF